MAIFRGLSPRQFKGRERMNARTSPSPVGAAEARWNIQRTPGERNFHREPITPVDLWIMGHTEPPPYEYTLPSLPRGKIALVSGWGGVGKSKWLLQTCLQVSAGDRIDLRVGMRVEGLEPAHRSLFFAYEEDARDVHHRIRPIIRRWEPMIEDPDLFRDIVECVHVYPLGGVTNATLFDAEGEPTSVFARLAEIIDKEWCPRFVAIDPMIQISDASENDNQSQSRVLRHLSALAHKSNVALLIAHHESKASQGNEDAGDAAARGASALQSNTRWTSRMRVMSRAEGRARGIEDERRQWVHFGEGRAAYGPPPPELWMRRDEDGVLVEDLPPESGEGDDASRV